jgi:acetylglutamate kinase
VLVHGGGPEISDMMSRLGKKPEVVDGLRVTDQETVDIVQMVLAGKVNKSLVTMLEKRGGNAIGLCGMDGKLIEAEMKNEKLGYVGEITKINIGAVKDILEKGYIPVISTLGCDKEGNAYNINADTAAAELAIALGAEKLILLTDVRGVLRDPKDENTLIAQIRLHEVPGLMASGVIGGGMIPKIQCCVDAVEHGVRRTHILDGRIPHSILTEMLSHKGVGTMIWE